MDAPPHSNSFLQELSLAHNSKTLTAKHAIEFVPAGPKVLLIHYLWKSNFYQC